jgi:hypothetical protein
LSVLGPVRIDHTKHESIKIRCANLPLYCQPAVIDQLGIGEYLLFWSVNVENRFVLVGNLVFVYFVSILPVRLEPMCYDMRFNPWPLCSTRSQRSPARITNAASQCFVLLRPNAASCCIPMLRHPTRGPRPARRPNQGTQAHQGTRANHETQPGDPGQPGNPTRRSNQETQPGDGCFDGWCGW